MGEGQERKNRLAPNSKSPLSANPVGLNKNHHAILIVSHHTVHLSVMDGSVGMTASRFQASTKQIPLILAVCSTRRIKTNSECKSEKTKALHGHKNALLAWSRGSRALLLAVGLSQPRSVAMPYNATARRQDLLQQSFFRFDCVRFSVHGSKFKMSTRLACKEVTSTTGCTLCYSPQPFGM